MAFRQLPRAGAQTPSTRNLLLNRDVSSFLRFTQAVLAQVDVAMALHRVRIAEKYGKNYLSLLQAVFWAACSHPGCGPQFLRPAATLRVYVAFNSAQAARADLQKPAKQETELLLQSKDINRFLMHDIAFLSGGRGKDNAWIITFPENCNFKRIPEHVIAKVLNYLTSIARQSGSNSRFTIILDRRQDTWSSLKNSLQKISNTEVSIPKFYIILTENLVFIFEDPERRTSFSKKHNTILPTTMIDLHYSALQDNDAVQSLPLTEDEEDKEFTDFF